MIFEDLKIITDEASEELRQIVNIACVEIVWLTDGAKYNQAHLHAYAVSLVKTLDKL